MLYGLGGGLGGGLGVGGAAASGIMSGFQMGREVDEDNDRKAQTATINARNAQLDAERQAQTQRTNDEQDSDRALNAVNQEMSDQAVTGAGLAQQYGGMANIPASVGTAYAAKANEIGSRRAAILQQRYAPAVKQEQQWAQDTASRIATGQMSMDDLSPADTVRLIQGSTLRPATDFLRPANGGNSTVGQGIADATAGIKTGNQSLTVQGANTLLAPEVGAGVGHVAPDGSTIVNKQLAALVPAPQQPQATPAQTAMQANPVQGLTAALTAATTPGAPPISSTNDVNNPSAYVAPNLPPAAAPAAPVNNPSAYVAPDATSAAASAGPATAPADTPPTTGTGMSPAADPSAAAPPTSAPAAPSINNPSAYVAPQTAAAPPLGSSTDPNKVIPVLQVTAQHPDGTQVTYHAPVTDGRSTDPNDPVSPGFDMSDAMDRVGKLGTLEAWANTPAAKAKIQQGLQDLGTGSTSFVNSYYAMHGDPKALLPAGATDPTTLKINAINKFATANNISFSQAAQQLEGKGAATGLQAKLDAINASSLSAADKAKATGVATGLVKVSALGAASGTGLGGPASSSPDTPDGVLAGLSKDDLALVKGVADGSIDPSVISTRQNQKANIVALAARYKNALGVQSGDGTSYNSNDQKVQTKTEAAYTGNGTPAKAIRSLNVASDHLATLRTLAGALQNGSTPMINQIANQFASATGQPAPTNFDMAKQFVGDEVLKAAIGTGGAGAQSDREAIVAGIKNSQSPAQLTGWIDTATKFIGGQLNGLAQGYTAGQGRKDFATTFLTPASRAAFPAGGGGSGTGLPRPASSGPSIGTVQQGYRFKGGDPAQQTSWERVQ